MSDIEREAFERIERQFTSGNSVSVDRASVRKEDWEAAKKYAARQAPASCNNGQDCEHCEPEHGCKAPASGEVDAEVWKDVVGFENEYSVSSEGRVKSKRTGYIKAGNAKSGAGYVKCDLYSQDNRLQTSVHRVVCEAFHGPSEGREVNHKNGVKADNRAENLEWSDRSANENHSRYVLGNLCKKLLAVNEETGEEVLFPSQRTAERVLGLTKDTVRQVLSGRKRNTKGWLFKHYTHPPAKVPEGVDVAVDMLEDYASALGNGDLDGAGHSTTQAIYEVISLLTTPTPATTAGKESCEWREDEGIWSGECGVSWWFEDGTPKENKQNFCPNCGKPCVQHEPQEQ